MTAKHTPGPWWRDDDGFIAAGSGDSYVTVADFDCSPDLGPDEREANKALAIAAHTMRAALADAERFIAGFTGDDMQDGIDGPGGLLARVRSALAQADGRTANEIHDVKDLGGGFTLGRDDDGDFWLIPPADVIVFSAPGEALLLVSGDETTAEAEARAEMALAEKTEG